MGAKYAVVVTALILLCCSSCGGGAALQGTAEPDPPSATGHSTFPPANLPAMPTGEPDAESIAAPRLVAGAAYLQDGAMVWQHSDAGAGIIGSALRLSSTSKDFAYGIWRWMGFFFALNPYELRIETHAAAGNQYWLLLADYSAQRWQVLGPFDAGGRTVYYDSSRSYTSAAGLAYVAVITAKGAEVTVDSLTLTPIAQAYTLRATEITSSSAKLEWYFPVLAEPPYPDIYNVYTGPEAGFQLADPGVSLLGSAPGYWYDSFVATGLEKDTHYYWKVQPGYLVGGEYSWGPLCEDTGEFTTLLSTPPQVNLYGPYYVQHGDVAEFSCYIDDEDSAASELTVQWDFETDGVIDRETTGPGTVDHTYAARGRYTASITVSDGVNTVPDSAEALVGFAYRDELGLYTGKQLQAVAYDRNPSDNKAVLLVEPFSVRTYNGASWRSIGPYWQDIETQEFCDVASSPEPYLLWVDTSDPQASWGLSRFTDGWEAEWWFVESAEGTSDTFFDAHMDLAANGLYSIVFAGGINGAPGYTSNLDVWHMKADGTYSTASVALDQDKFQACEVARTDTETYFAYCKDSGVHLWRFDDSSDSDTLEQSYSGDATDMVLQSDASMPGHVFWATLNGGRIYYGDNYGTPNGADQYITPPLAPADLVAVGLAGDNQGLVFWTDEDASMVQHLYGCNTAQGGMPFEITSGYGAAENGVGAFYGGVGLDGVELVVSEMRDGGCIRVAVEGGTVQSADQAAQPYWSKQIPAAIAVAQNGGGFWSLASQEYPSTLSMYAPGLSGAFDNAIIGEDSWCGLACAGPAADSGLFIGSYLSNGDLLLNHLDVGGTVGTELAALPGTASPRLIANRARSELHLFYLTNNETQIEERIWQGSDWSAPLIVASAASSISAYNVAAFADDSGWGMAYIDSGAELRLCEKSGGTWGAPATLLSIPLYSAGGIGIDYKTAAPAGDLLLAVTTPDVDHWLTAGVRPPGGSFSWQQFDPNPSTSNSVTSLGAFWQGDEAAVIALVGWGNLAVFENVHAQEFAYFLPATLRGAPVGMTAVDGGGIALAGAMTDSTIYRQKAVVLYP